MCFSMAWFQQLFVFVVIVCAIVAILKIIVPYVLKKAGAEIGEGMGILIQIGRVVLWAIVAIVVIYIAFALISCLLGWSGGMPLFPRGR